MIVLNTGHGFSIRGCCSGSYMQKILSSIRVEPVREFNSSGPDSATMFLNLPGLSTFRESLMAACRSERGSNRQTPHVSPSEIGTEPLQRLVVRYLNQSGEYGFEVANEYGDRASQCSEYDFDIESRISWLGSHC